MQRVPRKEECVFQLARPAGFDKAQIALLVRAVNLVTNEGMAERGQVNADLVGASGQRKGAHQRKFRAGGGFASEAAFDSEFRLRGQSRGMDGLF